MNNLIECHRLTKIFKIGEEEIKPVDEIDFFLERGEFVALMGPSGSGKTTFLNLLCGIDVPTSGKVIFEGKDLSFLSEKELDHLRLFKIGFVFQTFNLMPVLNTLENIIFPMELASLPMEARKKRAIELLSYLGLKKRIYHKPSELSAGERQRVAVARALANSPSLILADEPTGNLDSKTGAELISLFLKINKEKAIDIILVTHNPEVAKRAQKIYQMKDGTIIQ